MPPHKQQKQLEQKLYIKASLRITPNGEIFRNQQHIGAERDVVAHYRAQALQYPKFFKMDNMCKWGWLAAALLVNDVSFLHTETTAVVLHTSDGCIDVDKQFLKSTETIASPALFVYTLPNILLGEIAIAHGLKGQQTLLVTEHFDPMLLLNNVTMLRLNAPCEEAICGWVNVKDNVPDVCLFWVSAQPSELLFNVENCNAIYH